MDYDDVMKSNGHLLPDDLQTWAETQATLQGYGNVAEYVHQLVAAERRRQIKAEIEARLLAAVDDTDLMPLTPEYIEGLKAEFAKKYGRASKKKHAAKR